MTGEDTGMTHGGQPDDAPQHAETPQRTGAGEGGETADQRISRVIGKVAASMQGGHTGRDMQMLAELRALVMYIENAKSEIAALRPRDIKQQHIASATDELDAIVSSTEVATNTIMESAERIMELGDALNGEPAALISDEIIRIFEACSFQDITGQRIAKVVGALRHIETKIDGLVSVLGSAVRDDPARDDLARDAAADADAGLLNGPQLDGMATSQDEIDRLMSLSD